MNEEMILGLARQLRDHWKTWNDLDRGAVVVRLLNYGASRRGAFLCAGAA